MTTELDPQAGKVIQRALADLDMRLAMLELLLTERRQGWLYRIVLKDASVTRDALVRRIQRVRGTVRRTAAELGLTMADVRFDWLLMEFLSSTETVVHEQLAGVAPDAAKALREDLGLLHDVLPALGVEPDEAGDAGQPA